MRVGCACSPSVSLLTMAEPIEVCDVDIDRWELYNLVRDCCIMFCYKCAKYLSCLFLERTLQPSSRSLQNNRILRPLPTSFCSISYSICALY